ncbi:GGDEF domain-containing protein [Methylovirgula sp. 4M-Z18]|uniref:GGDEF domain-containing protein n=1 Tax=Methylovirgula sp. 4M-Z18 TaxID=2293567 RepID=UPI000E2F7AF6|nr:diguanylate cyclase [Methylovirgula sp. 4M-Z18]RFB78324.1 GGDEF domain-containing protein [Methylovirgula sp. 4M-Z18]
MNNDFTFLLPSTLSVFGTAFLIIWRMWRIRPALFWGLAYLLWTACLLLQTVDNSLYAKKMAILIQAQFLLSVFFLMHGLQALVGEPQTALRSRLVICLGTIGLASWLMYTESAEWAVLSVRLAMRLSLTGIALAVMWRHLNQPINKLLFTVVAITTIAILLTAVKLAFTSQAADGRPIYTPFLLLGYVYSNIVAIVFALTALGVMAFDITKRYRMEALLDPLSGLANRRQFDAFHRVEWQRAAYTRQHLSLLMIDVDMFKAFNDTYGHTAGDRCIIEVAQAISSCVRRHDDLCARVGGEEFVVILPGTPASNAAIVARNICEAVRSAAIPHEYNPHGIVTVSIGVATAVPSGDYNGSLLEAADTSLYKAKINGRNRVEMAVGMVQS